MSTTYRKTDKGQAEMATRQFRLAPKLRTALILVDGKRSDDELRGMIQGNADEVIQSLLGEGYIEAIMVTAAGAKAADGVAAAAAPFANTRPAPLVDTKPAPFASTVASAFNDTTPSRLDAAGPSSRAPGPSGPSVLSLSDAKRRAVRFLTDQLGPLTEGLCERIEEAKTSADLRPLLDRAQDVLRDGKGRAIADRFRAELTGG